MGIAAKNGNFEVCFFYFHASKFNMTLQQDSLYGT